MRIRKGKSNAELKSTLSNLACDGFALFFICSDTSEALIIRDLLRTNGIDSFVNSINVAPITGEMDSSIPEYRIFVDQTKFNDANKLLETSKVTGNGIENEHYSEQRHKKGIFLGRILLCITAIFFFLLYCLSRGASESNMHYLLLVLSFMFIIIFYLTFKQSEDRY